MGDHFDVVVEQFALTRVSNGGVEIGRNDPSVAVQDPDLAGGLRGGIRNLCASFQVLFQLQQFICCQRAADVYGRTVFILPSHLRVV